MGTSAPSLSFIKSPSPKHGGAGATAKGPSGVLLSLVVAEPLGSAGEGSAQSRMENPTQLSATEALPRANPGDRTSQKRSYC